jgi:hypothetical protein
VVQLDLRESIDDPVVQGKLVIHLSTDPSTTASSSRRRRPSGPSLALTSLRYDSRRPVNNASVDNYSVNNYSVNNYSVNNYSVNNYSVNNYSVDSYSVNNRSVNNNYSVHTASVYTASVNRAPVPELHSPSISLSRALSSHATPEVTNPIMAIPTTVIPETHLEQQQSLPNIPTRPVSSGGTSTADHPQNPSRLSAPGTVSPGQPITDAQHNVNTNEDQYGPLPEGWEGSVDLNTRSTTWVRPSSNQAVDHQAQEGETNTAGSGSLPAGWEERRTPDGRLYYVDHNNRSTWVDPRRQIMGSNGQVTSPQPQAISHLGALPSVREMGPLPTGVPLSPLDVNVPQPRRNFHQKFIYFRSQPAMCFQQHHVHCIIKVRRRHIYEDSYAEIMRQTPNNLKNRLKIMFEGENLLDLGGPAKFVPKTHSQLVALTFL